MTLSPSSQPFKDEIDIKPDLRSDTLDTRQDYEIKVTEKYTQKLTLTHTRMQAHSLDMYM